MKRKLIYLLLLIASLTLVGCTNSNTDSQDSNSSNEENPISDNDDVETGYDDRLKEKNPIEDAKLMGLALVKSEDPDDTQGLYTDINDDQILPGQVIDDGKFSEMTFEKEKLGDVGLFKGNNMDAGIPERSLRVVGDSEIFDDINVSALNLDIRLAADSHDGSPLDVYLIYYRDDGSIFLNHKYRLNTFTEDYTLTIQNDYEVEKANNPNDNMEYLTIKLFVEAKD